MEAQLSPSRLKSARQSYYVFNILTSFSFVLVSGSFITLYALRLGAGNSFIGMLNAMGYATFFFLPLGKRITRLMPIVKIFGYAWGGRYLAMIPVLLAPAFAAAGHSSTALALIITGVAGFNILRGVALIGNNPVLALLGGEERRSGSDRGAFLMNLSIVNSLASIAGSLLVALVLGKIANLGVYVAAIAFGIAAGLASAVFLLKTPEPAAPSPEDSPGLLTVTLEAMRMDPFRRFIVLFMILSFVAGMARSFLPTYAKEVYDQGDNAVMLYSLAASLGSVFMGLITRRIVDRLGSKPLLLIFTGLSLASLMPLALLPGDRIGLASPHLVLIILTVLNMALAFSFAGGESMGQNYYFSLVPKSKMLDLSVVYYFAFGLGGAAGSGLGGFVLDSLESLGLGKSDSYRIFYALMAVLLAFVLFRMRNLTHLGSASVRQSLGVMLSIRDLKAFDLLARMGQSEVPEEDARIIHEIGESAAASTQTQVAQYLSSPRFAIRMEALSAIENMEVLDPALARTLMEEVERHPFTTAYVAARILGKRGVVEAIPCLRAAMGAEDYMLQGASVVALARLGDQESRARIESIIISAATPRVKISAALALEILGNRESLPVLVSCLKSHDPPAFVSDEIVLASASLLGIMNEFYPLYKIFSEDEGAGIRTLASAAEDLDRAPEWKHCYSEALHALFAEGDGNAAPMSILVLTAGIDPADDIVLAEAILDPDLAYRGFRFLVAACPVLIPAPRSPDRSSVSQDRD